MNRLLRNIIALGILALSPLCHALDEVKSNEGLPMMVDSKSQLNDISLIDMTVTYTYELKNIEVDEAVMLKEINKEFIRYNACKDKQIRGLFEKGVDFKFVYKVQDEEILEIVINKDICNQIEIPCINHFA